MLPDAVQVADPFHVVQPGQPALDECRRRVQNETLGHRGRKTDPLYRCRRRLSMADERLSDDGHDKLLGLLAAGDPQRRGVVRLERQGSRPPDLRPHRPPSSPSTWVDEIGRDFADAEMPPEVRRLGRTIGALARPDRRLAPRPRVQRADRSGQQPRQTRQARRVRVPPLRPLPHPRPALRRQTQLDLLATITPR